MENKVSVQLKQLRKIVMQYPNYELKQLKDALLVSSNSELLCLLGKTLSKEISDISYIKCSSDYKWLCSCLKYMIEIISKDTKTHTSEHFYMVEKIKNIILTKQAEPKNNLPHNLKVFYENMLNIIKPLTAILDKQTKFERKRKKEREESKNLYHFAELLIYKYKNFDYFYQISKTYPYLINCFNEQNVPLIEALIKKQIKSIKNEHSREELDYFYRIINFIMSSNYLVLSNKQVIEIINYLKNEKNLCIDDSDNELENFLTEMINEFKSKHKCIGVTKDLRDLYKRYGIKELNDVYFPNIEIPNIEFNNTLDYTDKEVITLDLSKNIRIYDDAISCEVLDNGNYFVGVYIADLTDVILPQTELDYITYDRGETIYLDDKAIDMLPYTITSNYSLNSNENRKVLAFMFEFTSDAILYNFKVNSAIINVRNNLTFNQAQKLYLVNHNNPYGKIIKHIINLHQKFQMSKFYNENYHILKEQKRKADEKEEYHINNDCSNALATFMILVNSSIAKFFSDNGYPFLYRVNSSNIDDELTNKIKNASVMNCLPSEIHKLIDTVYSRSKYSHVNTGHHGLGLGYYCHVTNPIRNYASLVAQRMVKQEFINGGLRDKELYMYEQILPQIASSINNTIDTHNIFVEEYSKIKKKK